MEIKYQNNHGTEGVHKKDADRHSGRDYAGQRGNEREGGDMLQHGCGIQELSVHGILDRGKRDMRTIDHSGFQS